VDILYNKLEIVKPFLTYEPPAVIMDSGLSWGWGRTKQSKKIGIRLKAQGARELTTFAGEKGEKSIEHRA